MYKLSCEIALNFHFSQTTKICKDNRCFYNFNHFYLRVFFSFYSTSDICGNKIHYSSNFIYIHMYYQ